MDYAPTRIAGPIVDPVSLAEVRRHCRVSTNDDDELLNALTAAAIGHFDGWQGILNRCLITQTWQQTFDSFYSLELPFPVLSSVSVSTMMRMAWSRLWTLVITDFVYPSPVVPSLRPSRPRHGLELQAVQNASVFSLLLASVQPLQMCQLPYVRRSF